MRKIGKYTVLAIILFMSDLSYGQCMENYSFTAFPPPNGGTYNAGETVTFCFQTDWTYDIFNPEFLMGIEVNLGPGWDLGTLAPGAIPNNCNSFPDNTITCNGSGAWSWVTSYTNPLTGANMGYGFQFEDSDINPDNYYGDNCATTNNSCADDPCFTFCFNVSVLPYGTCIDGTDLTVMIDPLSDGEIGTDDDMNCAGDPNPSIASISSCCNVSAGLDNCVEFCDDPSIGLINLNDLIDNEDLGGTWYYGGTPIGTNFFNPADDPGGTYQYVVTGIGGCSDTSTLEITIHNFLSAGNATLFEFCEDQDPFFINTLNMPEDPAGQWLDPMGDPWGGTFFPTIDIDGEYLYITNSTGNCPSDTAFIDMFTIYFPDPGIDNSISVCSNQDPIDLFDALLGTPETGGVWSGPGTTTGGDLGTFDPSTEPGGVYTYFVANGSGNQCFMSAQITVILTNQLNAGDDNAISLCSATSSVNLIGYLSGAPDNGGVWTDQSSNVIPGGMLDPSNYPVNTPLTFDYDIGSGSCADSSVLTITFTVAPEAGMTSSGLDSIFLCGPDNVPFDLVFTNGNGPYSFIVEDQNSNQVINESGIIGGTYSESILVTSTSTFVLTSFDDPSNSCPGFVNSNDTIVVVVNSPPIGDINSVDDICLGNSIDLALSITGVGPFEIKVQENANPPVSYFGIGNIDVINVTPSVSGPVTYSLIEIIDNNVPPCTTTLNSSTSFNVFEPPNGIISGMDTICVGDQAQLQLGITGTWSDYSIWLNDGTNPYQFSNVNDGDFIDVPSPSTITYCLDSIAPVSFPSCVSQDVIGCVEIYVSDLPEIISFDVDCNPITEEGTVNITVNDGDSDDLSIIGIDGNIIANAFTSDVYPNGESFNVTVEDEFGCLSSDLFIDINCTCVPSFPGTMIITDTVTTCGSLQLDVSGLFNNDSITEPGDIIAFILHDDPGNMAGTIYSTNDQPLFFYTGALNYGQVYYVSPISGLNTGGSVNLNDPCLTVGVGVPIIFYPQPTADMLYTNVSSCSGMDAQLEILLTGGGPYTVHLENSSGPVPGSPFTIVSGPFIYSTSIEDIYTITAVSNDNCSGNSIQSQATVTSDDIPSVMVNENFVFCENGLNQLELTFTGEGPWTLDLELDGTPQAPLLFANSVSMQTILAEGTYVITGISDLNCSDILNDTIEVSFFENPMASISGGGTFCEGDSALVQIVFSGGNPDYNYSYTDGNLDFGPYTSSGNTIDLYAFNTGDFEIIDLSDQYCPGTFLGIAENNALALPIVDIVLSSNSICDGEVVTAMLEFNENGPFDLDFVNNGDTTSLQVLDGYEITLLPSDTTLFEVLNIVNTITGCATDIGGNITLNVIPLPLSDAGPDIFICPGDTVPMGSPSISGASYLWTNSAGLIDQFTSATWISLENFNSNNIVVDYELITTINGCFNSDTTQVTVYVPPSVDFYYNPDPILLTEPTVNLINLSDNDLYFEWNIETIGTLNEANPTIQFSSVAPNIYEVCLTGTDDNSCVSIYCDQLEVSGDPIVYIPNSFTPDGDGVNDYFYPVISNAEPTQYEFSIFNRWGEKVYTTTDYNDKWNGQGVKASHFADIETYIWVLQFKNPFGAEILNFQGHVNLIR